MASDQAMGYARVLQHAPVLVGADGDYLELGLGSAIFVAEAIEPFLASDPLDHDALTERLLHGAPAALGDGGRALTPEEVERIVHVCDLLMISNRVATPSPPPACTVVTAPAAAAAQDDDETLPDGLLRRTDLAAFDPTRTDQIQAARRAIVEHAEAIAYRDIDRAKSIFTRTFTRPTSLGFHKPVALLGTALRGLDAWYQHPEARDLFHEALYEGSLRGTSAPYEDFLDAATRDHAWSLAEQHLRIRDLDESDLYHAVYSATAAILIKHAELFTDRDLEKSAAELFRFEDEQAR